MTVERDEWLITEVRNKADGATIHYALGLIGAYVNWILLINKVGETKERRQRLAEVEKEMRIFIATGKIPKHKKE